MPQIIGKRFQILKFINDFIERGYYELLIERQMEFLISKIKVQKVKPKLVEARVFSVDEWTFIEKDPVQQAEM